MQLRFLRQRLAFAIASAVLLAACPTATGQNTFSFEASGCIDRRFGTFTIPATHNSYAAPPAFSSPNQNNYRTIPQQLADGIRFMEIDLHEINGTVYVVHGDSIFSLLVGSRDPVVVFQEIVAWLNANPNEILFIKFQETITDAELLDVMTQSGALPLIYVLPGGVNPSTLTPRDIVNSGKRLLTTGTGTVGVNSLLGPHWGSSPFDFPSIAAMDPYSAPTSRVLYNLIAYVTTDLAGFGSPSNATTINAFNFLRDYTLEGWQRVGKRPHSVTVDFHTLGTPIAVINELNNNYSAITGRVVDPATGTTFTSLTWQNTFAGVAVTTDTYGTFSFPVKRNTVTQLRPVKSGYIFVPSTVTVNNITPFPDTAATITAVLDTYTAWTTNQSLSGANALTTANPDKDAGNNLIEYAFGLNPNIADHYAPAIQATVSGSQRALKITFRRDTAIKDLIYAVEASDDLATWSTIAQSVYGAVTTGTATITETGAGTIKTVNATQTMPLTKKASYLRLRVTRP